MSNVKAEFASAWTWIFTLIVLVVSYEVIIYVFHQVREKACIMCPLSRVLVFEGLPPFEYLPHTRENVLTVVFEAVFDYPLVGVVFD